ncbi:MAG: lamin tail domain-containing protein, partial [Robiginitalea sp.]
MLTQKALYVELRSLFAVLCIHLLLIRCGEASVAYGMGDDLLNLYPTHSQVVLNEFMSSNNSTLSDEDGDYSDWIELFNAGAAVDLAGYKLSDDASALDKWTFPNLELDSGEHLLLFASGKDRLEYGG